MFWPQRFITFALFLGAFFFAAHFFQSAKLGQQFRTDAAKIQEIQYSLLNPETWKQKIGEVIRIEIQNIEISGKDREIIRDNIEETLHLIIDELEKDLELEESQKGNFFQELVERGKKELSRVILKITNLRARIPEFTDWIMEIIDDSQNREAVVNFMKAKINGYIDTTISSGNLTEQTNRICLKYSKEASIDDCRQMLDEKIEKTESKTKYMGWLLVIMVVSFSILYAFQNRKDRFFHYAAIPFLLVTLIVGVSTPMIDVDARISDVHFSLLSHELQFGEQVLFHSSKSILGVSKLLIKSDRASSVFIGILVLLFSVILPLLKICAVLIDQSMTKRYSIIRFLAYRIGKWSMADVMVVAIFMAYLGFNNIVDSQFEQLDDLGEGIHIITTNGTQLQPGLLLFVLFVGCSIAFSYFASRGRKM